MLHIDYFFSLYGSSISLVLRNKFHPEILMGCPELWHQTREGWGETSHFLALNVNISKTVGDTSKVRPLIGSRICALSIDIKIDDLELLQLRILSEFRGISQIWEQSQNG